MISPAVLGAASLAILAASPARAFSLSLSAADFTNTPVFSTVTTYALDADVAGGLRKGLISDPAMNDIQYSVSGSLDVTPSGFPAFGFQLNHIFPLSPPITSAEFYGLNPSAPSGSRLRFEVSASANLIDGLQLTELNELPVDPAAGIGAGVIFHFNGREEGTGRYHPMFMQLRSDGTGIVQNADNMGGVNPATMEVVDVDFGEEYITNLSFDPAGITIAVPEPSQGLLVLLGAATLLGRRRGRA